MMIIADLIDVAGRAQTLSIVGLLICAVFAMGTVIIVMFRKIEKDATKYAIALVELQRESVTLRIQQVEAVTKMTSAIESNTQALAQNSRLMESQVTRKITGR